MTQEEGKIKVIHRLEIVTSYLSMNYAVTMFAKLYNAGDIYRQMHEETGPVEAEDLDRWANLCMGVLDEGQPEKEKKAESDAALIESLIRHINTLETKINYQTKLLQEQTERLETMHIAYLHK
jgi:hypothetical protein